MNAPNTTKIVLLRLQSIVIGRKNSLNKRRVQNMRNVARAKFVAEARVALGVVYRARAQFNCCSCKDV